MRWWTPSSSWKTKDRVLYANPALGQLLGWQIEGLFGEPFVNLVPEHLRVRVLGRIPSDHGDRTPEAERRPSSNDVALRRWIRIAGRGRHISGRPQRGEARLLIAVVWDVRGRIDIDRYQRVSDELLAFLAGAAGTTAVLLPRLLSIVATSMDFEFATSWRWDSDSGRLHCEHVWRRDESDFESLHRVSSGMSVRSGEGLAGTVVNAGELVWRSDLAQAAEFGSARCLCVRRRANRLCLPDADPRPPRWHHRTLYPGPATARRSVRSGRGRHMRQVGGVHRAGGTRDCSDLSSSNSSNTHNGTKNSCSGPTMRSLAHTNSRILLHGWPP